MRCAAAAAVALLAAVMSVSVVLHAGARRPLAKPPRAAALQKTDTWPPTPQAKGGANLTAILTLDGPLAFRTFLGYLQQTNLVEVFQNQACLTDQGITIFVPVDKAFAAVKPSVRSRNLLLFSSRCCHPPGGHAAALHHTCRT